MSEHTEGWTAKGAHVRNEEGKTVCVVHGHKRSVIDPIAHLIAATPIFLATLETIAVLDPEEQDMWELQKWVRGVLAKVKGEGDA